MHELIANSRVRNELGLGSSACIGGCGSPNYPSACLPVRLEATPLGEQTARSGLAGGWAHGPCEAWAFARALATTRDDRDGRMAMLIVDNAAELALKTYFGLQRRHRGGPSLDLGEDPSFYALVDGFERCFGSWPNGLSRDGLLWMHDVRNTLHHRGNGLTADRRHLERYLKAVEVLLRFLFGDEPVDECLRETQQTPPSDLALPPRPAIIDELDGLVNKIRARCDALGSTSMASVVVPATELLDLVERVDDMLPDLADGWTPEQFEQLSDLYEWNWAADGLPETVDEVLAELAKMRLLLVVGLM